MKTLGYELTSFESSHEPPLLRSGLEARLAEPPVGREQCSTCGEQPGTAKIGVIIPAYNTFIAETLDSVFRPVRDLR
jgi:hypothetical protein